MFKLKSLGLSILAASVVFHSQALASVPEGVLNDFTNFYFWQVNPEMSNRNIKSHQTQYKKEWLAIKEVLKYRMVWMELPRCYADEGDYGYEIEDYGETIRAITDAVFYVRRPELKGRKIRLSETYLIR
ncbi:MAG: hypothetical protein F6J90_17905 [Moorea sp. SIOASIH]|uniref:hypothetical protein n=1 Tax=Moorena sp. SIOASIH TaxID=2607817 RepID=UPI0013BA5CB2|nr:hypothetical protein [Moorena sp. SIOASIH]NEO38101.1 hypothetical protein [Moorena sp. SIOASIH]